jgi:hypothetical protein
MHNTTKILFVLVLFLVLMMFLLVPIKTIGIITIVICMPMILSWGSSLKLQLSEDIMSQ